MALRRLRFGQDPILRKRAKEVKEITPKILELLDDMVQTMHKENGIGLAAPQVGVLRRVIVIDIGDGLIELINPEILEESGLQCDMEGCLSIPEQSGYVERPESIKVKGLNRNGEVVYYEASGLLAVVFCHEIDHLNGVLFTDKVVEVEEEDINDQEMEIEEELN